MTPPRKGGGGGRFYDDERAKHGAVIHTVDGQNPAPGDMVDIPLFIGF